MLYFSYGSNLYVPRFEFRCGPVTKIQNYQLPDYKLVFNTGNEYASFANIVPCKGSIVSGVIYDITPEQEYQLDIYEGVAAGCYKKVWLPWQKEGLLCYIGLRPCNEPPQADYLAYIYKGAISHDLINLADRIRAIGNIIYPETFKNYIDYEFRQFY